MPGHVPLQHPHAINNTEDRHKRRIAGMWHTYIHAFWHLSHVIAWVVIGLWSLVLGLCAACIGGRIIGNHTHAIINVHELHTQGSGQCCNVHGNALMVQVVCGICPTQTNNTDNCSVQLNRLTWLNLSSKKMPLPCARPQGFIIHVNPA